MIFSKIIPLMTEIYFILLALIKIVLILDSVQLKIQYFINECRLQKL